MSIQKLAQQALDVQDACNLSGVVHGFARAIDGLRACGITGTDEIRNHPISRAWADKIASLTGVQDFSTAIEALNKCEWMSKQASTTGLEPVMWESLSTGDDVYIYRETGQPDGPFSVVDVSDRLLRVDGRDVYCAQENLLKKIPIDDHSQDQSGTSSPEPDSQGGGPKSQPTEQVQPGPDSDLQRPEAS